MRCYNLGIVLKNIYRKGEKEMKRKKLIKGTLVIMVIAIAIFAMIAVSLSDGSSSLLGLRSTTITVQSLEETETSTITLIGSVFIDDQTYGELGSLDWADKKVAGYSSYSINLKQIEYLVKTSGTFEGTEGEWEFSKINEEEELIQRFDIENGMYKFEVPAPGKIINGERIIRYRLELSGPVERGSYVRTFGESTIITTSSNQQNQLIIGPIFLICYESNFYAKG